MDENKDSTNSIKFNFEDLIKEYQVPDMEVLTLYLSNIWKDLSLRSEDKSLGVNKATFTKVKIK